MSRECPTGGGGGDGKCFKVCISHLFEDVLMNVGSKVRLISFVSVTRLATCQETVLIRSAK